VIDKSIDRARVGISKSLLTSPCERKGAYGEWVRDEQGRRLDFPMPEKVTFGTAVDESIGFILYHELHDNTYTARDAVTVGIKAAQAKSGWALIEDIDTFRVQVENAVTLYLREDDGLARILSLRDENVRLQGDNGRTLKAQPDLIGTPDIITDRRVIDVKTAARKYDETKFVRSPEMPVYTELYAAEFGYLPDFLAYQVYVRVQKPYWQWIEVPATGRHVDLSRIHAARWRAGLAAGDINLFAFDASFCGDCPWSKAIPEVGFEGCPVGLAVNEQENAA